MKICVSLIRDLPVDLYKQLYSLNLRERGMMREALVAARRCKDKDAPEYNHSVIYAAIGDLVISWCIFMPEGRKMYTRKLAHLNDTYMKHPPVLQEGVVSLMFWTRAAYRKQGLAKKLGTYAAHHAQKLGLGVCKVGPWDKKSRLLMESLEKTSPLPVME